MTARQLSSRLPASICQRQPVARPARLASRVLAACVLAACVSAACASGGPSPHDVEVEVHAESGAPVSGAQLRVRGDYLGTTNPLGRATLRVPGLGGERLGVSVTCPPGFVAAEAEPEVVLPKSGATEHARVSLLCQTQQHDAVVVVHAGTSASLPVLVDGVPVAQTDALGFAHVHVRAAPDAAFEVSLDTSANAKLLPANPSRRFQIEGDDEVFVFDTAFDAPRPVKQRRGKRRARGT